MQTGRNLWAASFDRKLTPAAILEIRDELANHVVRTLAQPFGVIFLNRVRATDGLPVAIDPRKKAVALALRAIELAPAANQGHHALALAYYGRRVAEDLGKRNVRTDLIGAVVEGLRLAGLPGIEAASLRGRTPGVRASSRCDCGAQRSSSCTW